MVHLNSVRQLMHQHVIDELKGQHHQRDIETDRPARTTASPAARLMGKPDFFVGELPLLGEILETPGQVCLALFAKCLGDMGTNHRLHGRRTWIVSLRIAHDYLLVGNASLERIATVWDETQRM